MSIMRATIESSNTNKWGFPGYLIGGDWYGGDKKGAPVAGKGETIEFEHYLKDGKYKTIKVATVKVVTGGSSPVVSAAEPAAPKPVFGGARDTYWADKAATDAAKEPRINYVAARNTAIAFLDLAHKTGALAVVAKAKPAAQYDILKSLFTELTDEFAAQSYSAKPPVASANKAAVAPEVAPAEPEAKEDWS